MNAEILCVGTELLLGDVINTNAAYLARELAALGIGCYYQSVVGDNAGRLEESLRLALSRADMVIATGGLGPTYDDLTKETVANYFGLPMELHQPSLENMTAIMSRFGRSFSKNNEKQAYMPKGAIVFDNDRGTAPGLAVEGGGKLVIMLPGPPQELMAMFEKRVRPYLAKKSDQALRSHTIHLFGIGESAAEAILHDAMVERSNPTIAPYAKPGEVQLRVTASAPTEHEAEALLAPVVSEIRELFAQYVYGIDVGNLQTALTKALMEKNHTIAVAESCTGGMITARLTDVPGVSQVLRGGVCCYSNEAKRDVLGVEAKLLEQCGAVSEEAALAMARGVRSLMSADIGLSVTGIAGPDGGSPEKPVGLVYVGAAGPWGEEVIRLMLSRGYGNDREYIRNAACLNAMNLVYRRLMS